MNDRRSAKKQHANDNGSDEVWGLQDLAALLMQCSGVKRPPSDVQSSAVESPQSSSPSVRQSASPLQYGIFQSARLALYFSLGLAPLLDALRITNGRWQWGREWAGLT